MNRDEYLIPIFSHQFSLMKRFHAIEEINRPELPWSLYVEDLDSIQGQLRMKEYAWRITEEIGEALSELENAEKYREEIADAFHFLVEMYLMVKIGPDDFPQSEFVDPLSVAFLMADQMERKDEYLLTSAWEYWAVFIKDLAGAMNLLKNRPWKVRFTKLDPVIFTDQMLSLFSPFIRACAMTGINRDILFESYMRKAETNDQRIKQGV